jgi:glycosyltransferase involved in cell wall biosynthesis
LGYYVVIHHHSYAYISQSSLAMKLLVRTAGNRGRHVLLCPEMRDRFDRAYRPRRASALCSNAIWLDETSPAASRKSPRHGLRIGHLGSLTRDKGFLEVADLAEAANAQGIDVELWLAGAIPTRRDQLSLDSVLGRLGPERARWLGVLLGDDKASFFNEIDVFVLPTRYRHEAQPLVVFEALQAGVPVVSYAVGCIPSQLGSSGLLVPTDQGLIDGALAFITKLQDDEAMADARRVARESFERARSESADQARALLAEIAVLDLQAQRP